MGGGGLKIPTLCRYILVLPARATMPASLNPARASRSMAAATAGAAVPAQGCPVAAVVTAVQEDSVSVAARPLVGPQAAPSVTSAAAPAQNQVSLS